MHKNITRVFVWILSVFFALTVSACGNGKSDPNVTTIELNKDGTVTQTIVGRLDENQTYDDLNAYINGLISAYTTDIENPRVVLDSMNVSGGNSVKIHMTYSSMEDYASFNHVDAFIGTVDSAYRAGYRFDRSFQTAAGAGLSGYAVPVEYPGLDVIVLKEAMNVVLPSDAILVSDDITRNDDGSLSIARSVKESVPEIFQTVNMNCSYIVFQMPESE